MWVRSRGMIVALLLLASLLSGESQSANAEAITIRLQPNHAVANVGEAVMITVQVDGAVDLGAFEFHLGYDPAVLQATDASLGTFLTSTGRTPVPLGPALPGDEIRFASVSYGTAAGPDGTGVLAQVTFRVLGQGTSALTFNRVIVTDTDAQVLSARAIDGTFTTGERPYSPVYLPLVVNQAEADK